MVHYTTQQIEALDRVAVEGGLEVRQMMELAGFHLINIFEREHIGKSERIAIVCGTGNKGGDGLSAARHLVNNGWQGVSVVLAGEISKPNPMHHLALIKTMGIPVLRFSEARAKSERVIHEAQTLVDALIGYHIVGAPRGAFEVLIRLMNESAGRTIAYDLPSGMDSTTGASDGISISADATMTLAVPKQTFATAEGSARSGAVYVADIGIPSSFYDLIIPGSRPDFEARGVIEYHR